MITDRKSESIKRQSSFALGPSEKSSTEGRVSSTERKAVRTFFPRRPVRDTLFSPRPLPLVTLFLLPRHDLSHGQLVVRDQLPADIQRDLVELAGERERRLIIGRNG